MVPVLALAVDQDRALDLVAAPAAVLDLDLVADRDLEVAMGEAMLPSFLNREAF